jgi:membrane protease YdiL (CAAX protease family)
VKIHANASEGRRGNSWTVSGASSIPSADAVALNRRGTAGSGQTASSLAPFAGRLDRVTRFAVALAVVGTYIALGILLRLDATAYLLLGIPIVLVFQKSVARRPVQALWLIDARPFRFDRIALIVALGLAVVPAILVIAGVVSRDVSATAYGLAALAGVAPAAYALRAMDSTARRALVRSIATAGFVGGGAFVLAAVAAAKPGFLADPVANVRIFVFSLLQYIPIVFVIEEVLFRGLLDTYVRGPHLIDDRKSAVFISALWGLWHLPLTFAANGLATLPVLLIFHTALGVLLTSGWRRSGNLAVPGLTHALIDAIRNALLLV